MTWHDSHPPNSWKEWYSKDGVAKAASFMIENTPWAAGYTKIGTQFVVSDAQANFTSIEAADEWARLYIEGYDKTKATESTDTTTD